MNNFQATIPFVPEKSGKSKGISVELGVDLLAKFNAKCKARPVGRTQKDVIKRLVEWFCDQEPLVRTVATLDIDPAMESAYAAALEAMARRIRERLSSKNGPPTPQIDLIQVAGEIPAQLPAPPVEDPAKQARKPRSGRA